MTTIEKEFVKQLNNILQADISYNLRKSILLIYLDIILDERIALSKEITSWALMKIYTIGGITDRQHSTKHKNERTFADIFYDGTRIGTSTYKKATDIFVEHFNKLCEEVEKKDFPEWLDHNPYKPVGYIAGDGLIQHLKMDSFTKAKQKDIEYYKQRKKNLRSLYDEGLISMNVCATELEHVNKTLEKYEC